MIDVRITGSTDGNSQATDRLESTCRQLLGESHEAGLSQEVEDRLQLELQTLDRLGISGLVLELVSIADDIAGRGHEIRVEGAAAGSLVLYALGVAKVCPLRHGMLFERFIDPDLESYPKGPQAGLHPTCVSSQHSIETLRVLRQRGYEFQTVDQQAEVDGTQECWQSIQAGMPDADSSVPHLLLHIAGPSVVSLTIAILGERPGRDRAHDQAVFELLGRGETDGIFGLEHPAMQDALRAVKPESLDELAAVMALGDQHSVYRRRLFDRFVARDGDAPALESESVTRVLAPNRGLLFYQDDLMTVLRHVGAFTLHDAYELIRAVIKHEQDRIEEARRLVVSRSSGAVTSQWAEEMFELVVDRAAHSMCKAHCYATAYNCVEAAHLKAHCPDDFRAAVTAMSG